MTEEEIKKIKKHLAIQLERYVEIFKKEFLEYIPSETLEFLNSITNYEELIVIEDTGTISCFVRNRKIYLPLLAGKVLKILKLIPWFGCVPNHKTYQEDTLIINDNTFFDYIKHTALAGLTVLEFYEEMLLHEAMHLCGLAGSSAFQEGITELKTRELAKKYNLKTSACGYPKEVKIIYRLQEIFGVELINRIAFQMFSLKRRGILLETVGQDGLELFEKIARLMEIEFQNKYYKYIYNFNGPFAALNKAKKYNDIDYTEVYKVIDEYCDKYVSKKTVSAKN